jgi:hypothetical protein
MKIGEKFGEGWPVPGADNLITILEPIVLKM